MQNSPGLAGIVTFLTDFGLEDGYVGAMKGALLRSAPAAKLVDISNQVPTFNLRVAALILEAAFPTFPPGTVHLMVVDPGVGSNRRHLLLEAKGHFFIGPDNGVLGRIAKFYDGKGFEIDPQSLGAQYVSNTFHGRDIYALAAGKLLAEKGHRAFTEPLADLEVLEIPEPMEITDGYEGEVIYVDHFGNLVTNLRQEHCRDGYRFFLEDQAMPKVRHYAALGADMPGVVLNSWGYYEIAFFKESAARALNLQAGAKILVGLSNLEQSV